jgi:putative oxidoreductase
MNATLQKYAPWMLGILRIVTALVYMEHGTQKLFHFPPMAPRPGAGGAARGAVAAAQHVADAAASAMSSAIDTASSMLGSAADVASSAPANGGPSGGGLPPIFLAGGLIEVIGGIALVLGIFSRPVAFIVAGECAVIFWWMHVPRGGIFPATNGGEAAVLFCFTFLYLVFAGPGAFAIDNLMARRRTA